MIIAGSKFGGITVCGFAFKRSGKHYFECVCKCGNKTVVSSSNLRSGHTKSCGCLRVEFGASLAKHGMKRTKIYSIWSNMIDRCYNKNNRSFNSYGGRGIKVCNRWRRSFVDFYRDVGEPPHGRQLDRVDNNKGYSPSNFRWSTVSANCRNKRNNRIVRFGGEAMCLASWEDRTGISQKLILDRIRRGWDVGRILTTPVIVKYRNTQTKNK